MSFSNGQNVQAADLNNFSVTTVTTSGDVTVGDDLIVTDDAEIGGDLEVTGAAAITGALTVNSVAINPAVVALSDGATPALNAALGSVFTLAAEGNRTIAVPSNPTSGQKIIIAHTASGGSNRTLALNSGAGGFRFGTDIIELTATTSTKTDYIGCVYNATASFWDVVGYVKGY